MLALSEFQVLCDPLSNDFIDLSARDVRPQLLLDEAPPDALQLRVAVMPNHQSYLVLYYRGLDSLQMFQPA